MGCKFSQHRSENTHVAQARALSLSRHSSLHFHAGKGGRLDDHKGSPERLFHCRAGFNWSACPSACRRCSSGARTANDDTNRVLGAPPDSRQRAPGSCSCRSKPPLNTRPHSTRGPAGAWTSRRSTTCRLPASVAQTTRVAREMGCASVRCRAEREDASI